VPRPWHSSPRTDDERLHRAAGLIAAGLEELVADGVHSHATPEADRWGAALGAHEAAAYLGIGATTLRALDLPTVRIGDRRLWRRDDLDAYLAGLPAEHQ
jgi:excisionase family DNA binding protein